jgi:hypothetical protein
MRTVCTTSSDGPRATRAARTVRDVRADCPPNHFPPKATDQPDRNEGAQEHAKNMKNTWAKMHHADYPHPPRGLSARCENSRLRASSRAPYHLSFQGSSTKMHEATIHDSHQQIRAQTP